MKSPFLVYKSFLAVSLGLLWIILLIPSCDVQPSTLGRDILPDDDDISVGYDMSSVLWQFTTPQDSIQTSFGMARPFGEYSDPVFGKIRSSLLTEFISAMSPDFAENAVADSLIFWMRIDSIYGDRSQQMLVELFEMNLPLDTAVTYKSFTNPLDYAHGDKYLGSSTYIPGDSVILFKTDLRLSAVRNLTSRLLSLDTTVMQDQNEFVKVFPGIHIKPSRINPSGSGSIVYPPFYNIGLTLHYHYADKPDSLLQMAYYGNVSVGCYDFSYQNALIEPYLNDSINPVTLGFIQGMGGSSLICDLKDAPRWLDSMQTGNFAINKARLIIKPKDMSSYGILPSEYPGQLDIFYVDQNNEYAVPMALSSGIYDAEKNEYSFSLNEHFLQYLGRKNSYTRFKIVPYYSYNSSSGEYVVLRHYSGKRVVLDLTQSQLRIFYSKTK